MWNHTLIDSTFIPIDGETIKEIYLDNTGEEDIINRAFTPSGTYYVKTRYQWIQSWIKDK